MSATGTAIRASVEARRMAVTVVGLSGAPWGRVLKGAGYEVSLEQWVAYARLESSQLLVLALASPEPEAWDVVRHLRERSSIPVLALVAGLTDDARWHLIGAGADGYLDSASTDEAFLAAVDAVLASVSNTVPLDRLSTRRANTRILSPA
jgi:DNA-binding response OmpR family regulator